MQDFVDDLRDIEVTASHDPDRYFPYAEQLCSDFAVCKKSVSFRQYKKLVTNGIDIRRAS